VLNSGATASTPQPPQPLLEGASNTPAEGKPPSTLANAFTDRDKSLCGLLVV